MARTRTLEDLVEDVRQRTNMENSEFVTDNEITEYLNQEFAELVTRLTANESQPHFRSTQSYSVVTGDELYDLPADFWKVQRVTCTIDGIERDMEPFMEGERANLVNTQLLGGAVTDGPRYRIQADNIEVLPATRSFTMTLYYVRSTPRLVEDSDTFDGFNGYEVAAIYGACATVLAKEESDPSFYLMQKERIYKLIDAAAAQRDASHPERVTDVTGGLSIAAEWIM